MDFSFEDQIPKSEKAADSSSPGHRCVLAFRFGCLGLEPQGSRFAGDLLDRHVENFPRRGIPKSHHGVGGDVVTAGLVHHEVVVVLGDDRRDDAGASTAATNAGSFGELGELDNDAAGHGVPQVKESIESSASGGPVRRSPWNFERETRTIATVTPQELEVLVRRTARAVLRGERYEDSTIELKSEHPEAHKLARQVAAHANAARGDDIVWIFGLREGKDGKPGSLEPLSPTDLDSYWRSAEKYFREASPDMFLSKLVSFESPDGPDSEVTLQALAFHTQEAPYVITNEKSGDAVSLEVPWRRGHNQVWTARRRDLLEILVPRVRVPACEVIDAKIEFHNVGRTPGGVAAEVTVRLYVSPHEPGVWLLSFRGAGQLEILGVRTVALDAPTIEAPFETEYTGSGRNAIFGGTRKRHLSASIHTGPHEVRVDGPGMISVSKHFVVPAAEEPALRGATEMRFTLAVPVALVDVPLGIEAILRKPSAASPLFLPAPAPDGSAG